MELAAALLVAFVTIVPVELPDKTFVATLVLSTRYPALPTWLGAVAAFAVQCVIAVLAGSLLTKLPERPVQLAAAALFATGAVVLAGGARRADAEETKTEHEYAEKVGAAAGQRAIPAPGLRAAGASFLVLFTAEWGDLSQLLLAGLVASGQPALPTLVGGWLGLATVSGAAVLLGRWLLGHVRLSVIRYVGAGVCAVLATITLISVA